MDRLRTKLYGLQKTYSHDATSFTKHGMWPERYHAELTALRLAAANGVQVPRVYRSSLESGSGTIVMERIDTPLLSGQFPHDSSSVVWTACGETLAKIHSLPSETIPTTDLFTRRYAELRRDGCTAVQLPERIVRLADRAYAWAISRPGVPVLVHGDFTAQNMFWDGELIVFDWEHACRGPAGYDLGSFESFLGLAVTDFGWTYGRYDAFCRAFEAGYAAVRPLTDDDRFAVSVLRYLGHRQVSQWCRFVAEAVLTESGTDGDSAQGDPRWWHGRSVAFSESSLMAVRRMFASPGYTLDRAWWARLREVIAS